MAFLNCMPISSSICSRDLAFISTTTLSVCLVFWADSVKVVSNDGSETSDSVKLALEKTDVVKYSSYDTGTHKFENTLGSVVVFDTADPEGTSPAEVFTATSHSSEAQ